MAILAEKKEGGNFKTIEAGTYIARCYSMIEIGTVKEEFQGKTKMLKKVNITWELPTELAIFKEEKGEEPFVISKTYTLSMHEKSTLRRDLESWRGKGFTDEEAKRFDITKLLGIPAMITVIQKPKSNDPTKTVTEVTNITKPPKGYECPAQINPSRVLSFDNFDDNVFASLTDWLKDKIRSSVEFKSMTEPNDVSNKSDLPWEKDEETAF